MGESQRLDDAEVQRRLARLDEVLDHVERMPGPTAESAVEAVRTLTEVYGEALARVLDTAGAAQAEALCADELLSHLFVLHDIHPGSLADRAERALAYVRPHLERKGAGWSSRRSTPGSRTYACGPQAAGAVPRRRCLLNWSRR